MTPVQFAASIGRIRGAFATEVKGAETRTLQQARDALIKRSSGTIKTATLRKMGHPFATRDPQTPLDPSIINDQGGDFRRSWKKAGPRARGGGLVSSVVNTDPKAKYMLGTSKMVARRADVFVADQIRPIRRRNLRLAIRRALRTR